MSGIYLPEKSDLNIYKPDVNILLDKRFLEHIHHLNYKEPAVNPQPSENPYPYCNAYYSHTEDVDARNRVPHYLTLNLANHDPHSLKKTEHYSWYSERNAHLKYLRRPPTSFMLLGKPDVYNEHLGKMLSDHWNCVYIHPKTLIEDEIKSGSRPGTCIEFNLRCGKSVGVDIILHLLVQRLQYPDVQHRGFIICGFPLLPNDLYKEDPLSSESAVFNVQDIFDDLIENVAEHGGAPNVSADPSQTNVIPPKESDVSNISQYKIEIGSAASKSLSSIATDYKKDVVPEMLVVNSKIGTDLGQQMEFIFNLCNDYVITIYLKCSNEDLIKKTLSTKWDSQNSKIINFQAELSSHIHTIYDKRSIEESTVSFSGTHDTSAFNSKFFTLQRHYPVHVNVQLEKYYFEIMPIIEKHILTHDPMNIIRLDARQSLHRVYQALKSRLNILPVSKAIIPQLINLNETVEYIGEDVPEQEPVGTGNQTIEEMFLKIREQNLVSPIFKWALSNWSYLCPVSMTDNNYITGDPKYAVSFLNKVYFLADEEAAGKFIANPRPYLLPPYPKLTSRFIVIGPPVSGKSAVSKCISYLQNGVILNADKIVEEHAHAMRDDFLEQARLQAIQDGIALYKANLKAKSDERELLRQQKLIEFIEDLKTKIRTRLENEEIIQKFDRIEFTSFALPMAKTKPSYILLAEDNILMISKYFEGIGLSTTEDMSFYMNIVDDDEYLQQFIPSNLKIPIVFDPDSIFIRENHPFINKYVQNVLDNFLKNFKAAVLNTLDMKAVAKRFVRIFKVIDEQKYSTGWILDGTPIDIQFLPTLFASTNLDNIIIYVLMDDTDHTFLMGRLEEKFANIFDGFQQLFEEIGEHDAACRVPAETHSANIRFVADTIEGILDHVMDEMDNEIIQNEDVSNELQSRISTLTNISVPETTENNLLIYKKHLNTFDAYLEETLEFFDKNFIKYTKISIENKSMRSLMQKIAEDVQYRLNLSATLYTGEDRIKDLADLGQIPVEKETEEDEEALGEDVDIVTDKAETEEFFKANRRLGDTSDYCPVAFSKYWVLWKGKDEYTVKFENQLYMCHSEESMEEFLSKPCLYLSRTHPPVKFPPPRICIVGSPASGKTSLALSLARRLGLFSVNFDQQLALNVNHNIVKIYLENDEPIGVHLEQILKTYWFVEPYKSNGFVIDGFPKRPSDIQCMIRIGVIPDLIIELSVLQGALGERLFNSLMKQWHIQMEIDQNAEALKKADALREWEQNRAARIEELLEMRKEARYLDSLEASNEDEESRTKSQMSYKSSHELEDMAEINVIVEDEFPEPVFNYEWETEEEAKDRITSAIDSIYETEMEYISTIENLCNNEQIGWVTVDATLSIDQVYNQAVRYVLPIRSRNQSVFERTYDISLDVADRLLSTGYFLLSDFGKTCPVQAFEKENMIQLKTAMEHKDQLYPIIYRSYIYFLAGSDNRIKFKSDPIQYVSRRNKKFPLVHLRIAVIGPPKCGKTTLAKRMSTEYGLKLASVGQSVRYVLKFLDKCVLADEIEHCLREGDELSDEQTMACVEAITYDPKAILQGIIMDGFPNSIEEVNELTKYGLVPHLIIDLKSTKQNMFSNMTLDDTFQNRMYYSRAFMDSRYDNWLDNSDKFRNWIDTEYQNRLEIPADLSQWYVWKHSNGLVLSAVFEIKHYYKHVGKDVALRVGNMLVTPLEFLQRLSRFKHFCPSCLYIDGALVHSGTIPNRRGLVQYKDHFYWLCDKHIGMFIDVPTDYLPPINVAKLPENLPEKVSLVDGDFEHNGFCPVCYLDNIPNKTLNQGSNSLAVVYNDKHYLFDTEECLQKALMFPKKYFYLDVPSTHLNLSSIEMKDLEILGYLEQYTANQLVAAVIDTESLRPCAENLSIEASALINIALHLKIHNPSTPKEFLPEYQKMKELLENQRHLFMERIMPLKNCLNPFVRYDEPTPPLQNSMSFISDKPSSDITKASRSFVQSDIYLDF